jgi:hypothetical protein
VRNAQARQSGQLRRRRFETMRLRSSYTARVLHPTPPHLTAARRGDVLANVGPAAIKRHVPRACMFACLVDQEAVPRYSYG